mgnify:CR=1 FL=1
MAITSLDDVEGDCEADGDHDHEADAHIDPEVSRVEHGAVLVLGGVDAEEGEDQ